MWCTKTSKGIYKVYVSWKPWLHSLRWHPKKWFLSNWGRTRCNRSAQGLKMANCTSFKILTLYFRCFVGTNDMINLQMYRLSSEKHYPGAAPCNNASFCPFFSFCTLIMLLSVGKLGVLPPIPQKLATLLLPPPPNVPTEKKITTWNWYALASTYKKHISFSGLKIRVTSAYIRNQVPFYYSKLWYGAINESIPTKR